LIFIFLSVLIRIIRVIRVLYFLPVIGKYHPLDLRFFSEIQQQTNFFVGSFEVVNQLRLVAFIQLINRLQFQNNHAIDNNIGEIFSYRSVIVINRYVLV